jgi:PAS domain S-box-containing protein
MVFYSLRNLIIAYAITGSVILLTLLYAFNTFRSEEHELLKIQQSREALQTLESSLVNLQEFESGLNGFVNSPGEQQPDFYNHEVSMLQYDSLRLMQLAGSGFNILEYGKYRHLVNLLHQMKSFAAVIIHLREVRSFDIAKAEINKGTGTAIVADLKTLANKLEEENRDNLAGLYSLHIKLTRKTFVLTGIFSGLLILVLVVSFRVAHKDIKNRFAYTGRKRTEEKFIEREELLRLFVDNSPVSLAMFDMEMKYIIASRRWMTDYKLGDQELPGKSHYEVFPEIPQRWRDIHQRCLAGAIEKNDEDSFTREDGTIDWIRWEIHPWHKASGEAGGIIMFTEDITERKIAEEDLEASYKAIRKLTCHLQNIREEERTHIAREIHDELGQQLTVMKMDASWLNKKVGSTAEDIVKQKMQDLLSTLDGTVKTVRRIASDLRPSLLDDLGLIAAMEWQLAEFEKRSGIKTNLADPGEELKLPDEIKTGLFRIFQESLTNVVRHADARKVKVSLQQKEGSFVLLITDDGKGFDQHKIADQKTLGLLGMKERTSMIGGTYDIISAPGKGTTVVVTIPSGNHN